MDKKFMNKLDDMELNKVAGGKMGTNTSPPRDLSKNIFTDFYKFLKRIIVQEVPTSKSTPAAPKKPTIDPEEARRQYMKEMKDILNKQKPITDTWP